MMDGTCNSPPETNSSDVSMTSSPASDGERLNLEDPILASREQSASKLKLVDEEEKVGVRDLQAQSTSTVNSTETTTIDNQLSTTIKTANSTKIPSTKPPLPSPSSSLSKVLAQLEEECTSSYVGSPSGAFAAKKIPPSQSTNNNSNGQQQQQKLIIKHEHSDSFITIDSIMSTASSDVASGDIGESSSKQLVKDEEEEDESSLVGENIDDDNTNDVPNEKIAGGEGRDNVSSPVGTSLPLQDDDEHDSTAISSTLQQQTNGASPLVDGSNDNNNNSKHHHPLHQKQPTGTHITNMMIASASTTPSPPPPPPTAAKKHTVQ